MYIFFPPCFSSRLLFSFRAKMRQDVIDESYQLASRSLIHTVELNQLTRIILRDSHTLCRE